MNQSNNDNMNALKINNLDKVELDVSALDSIDEGLIIDTVQIAWPQSWLQL